MAFGERPASYDMQMQVKNGLTSLGAIIDHQAKRITHAQLLGEFACDQHQMTQQRLIV
jgi:hypothetical protein